MSDPIKMANGSYPISDQHSANSAWKLRNHSKEYSEAQVVAHIRAAVAKLGLTMPKNADDSGDGKRQAAAMDITGRPHGFAFPPGLPECSLCGLPPNDPTHVNPAKGGQNLFMGAALNGIRMVAAESQRPVLRRSHAYTQGVTIRENVRCQACGQPMGASVHVSGMPSMPGVYPMGGAPQMAAEGPVEDNTPDENDTKPVGVAEVERHEFEALPGQESQDAEYRMCAKCGFAADNEIHGLDEDDPQAKTVVLPQTAREALRVLERALRDVKVGAPHEVSQKAFVNRLNGKTLVTAPASVFTECDAEMPRELAKAWQETSQQNGYFQWIEGRYVEADRPNRNKAAWTSGDLELGEPSVAHGPINWLHDERHIIGTIAAAKLIQVCDESRQAAADMGVEPVNNHIRALAPVWKYLFPVESRIIAQMSEQNKLWLSMECYSREVACMAPGCTSSQSYADYMRSPAQRCQHMRDGGNRRFVDPVFTGAGIIIPPVRPGWGGANAQVLRQAAALAGEQETSLVGLSEQEAVGLALQLITYAGA